MVASRIDDGSVGIRRQSRAFTLVELLVVVAIIVVLAGFLTPALGLVRASARTSSCHNNLRQLSLCVAGYANDNEQYLPSGYAAAGAVEVSWDDRLSPYDGRDLPASLITADRLQLAGVDAAKVKLYQTYACPGETAKYPGDPNNVAAVEVGRFLRSYAMNRAWNGLNSNSGKGLNGDIRGIYADGSTTIPDWAANTANIRRPANTILLAEIRYVWGRLGGQLGATVDNPYSGVGSKPAGISQIQLSGGLGNTTPLHRGRWNYLFCDGHTATMDPRDTLGPGMAVTSVPDAASMWIR